MFSGFVAGFTRPNSQMLVEQVIGNISVLGIVSLIDRVFSLVGLIWLNKILGGEFFKKNSRNITLGFGFFTSISLILMSFGTPVCITIGLAMFYIAFSMHIRFLNPYMYQINVLDGKEIYPKPLVEGSQGLINQGFGLFFAFIGSFLIKSFGYQPIYLVWGVFAILFLYLIGKKIRQN
jgi:hypothetical protein